MRLLKHLIRFNKRRRECEIKGFSSLLVLDSSNKPIGIITERDLVRKVCANDSSSKNTMVIDIMSIGLVTMDGISDVGVAVDIIMSNKEGEWHPYEITGDIH